LLVCNWTMKTSTTGKMEWNELLKNTSPTAQKPKRVVVKTVHPPISFIKKVV